MLRNIMLKTAENGRDLFESGENFGYCREL